MKLRNREKMIHYAWLLLSIVLMAGELPEDSHFPIIDRDLPKAAKYALLWATKDAKRIHNSKILLVFMEMNLIMEINRKLCCHSLSITAYRVLQNSKRTSITFTLEHAKTRPKNG